MQITKRIREPLEIILASGMMLGIVFVSPALVAIINRNHYNSLSRQEKIEYLENRLRTYTHPPMMGPKLGGAILLWYEIRQKEIKELNRLRQTP